MTEADFWSGARRTLFSPSGRNIAGLARDGIAVFRGINFAHPPIGALRFQKPQRCDSWPDGFDATEWGATPQRVSPGFAIPEPSVPGDATLNLNIFTRESAVGEDPRLPVIVWIHGGGFTQGSANGSWYDGRRFAQKGVVVVSIHYRVGIEGFADIEGATPNRAVWDWIAALEWVRENIAHFGGDPARVTIVGESAGGAAVLALLATPHSAELFAAAWCMSGVLTEIDAETARARAVAIAAELGVPATVAGFSSISDTIGQAHVRAIHSLNYFGPSGDPDLFPLGILGGVERFSRSIPLVFGVTADEFEYNPAEPSIDTPAAVTQMTDWGISEQLALRAANAISADHRLTGSRVFSEVMFRSAAVAIATTRGGASSPTWAYDYRWPSERSGYALHCEEIPALFAVTDDPAAIGVLGTVPTSVVAAFHGAMVAFAHDHRVAAWDPLRGSRLDIVTTIDVHGASTGTSPWFTAGDILAQPWLDNQIRMGDNSAPFGLQD
jgi:para-nitrobenzyl esterase